MTDHDQRLLREAIARHLATIRDATRKLETLVRYLRPDADQPPKDGP